MKTAKEFFRGLCSYHPEQDADDCAALEARDREVKAEALREAANYFSTHPWCPGSVTEHLRHLADEAERGE
jgi:hypothetical protein